MMKFVFRGWLLACVFSFMGRGGEVCAQPGAETDPQGRGELRILWYNVENFFHPSLEDHDTTEIPGDVVAERCTADREFSPEGIRHWSQSRYRDKLTRIARVIVAAGAWNPPELVGLCEVENARVLEDLVDHPILRPWNYSYLHRDSPDHRGMDVALLFRDPHIEIRQWNWIAPVPWDEPVYTRFMLHVRASWGNRDELDLILVHLISRYGGSGATAGYRREQNRYLACLADSLHQLYPSNLLVLAGDFNDEDGGWTMEPLESALTGGDSLHVLSPASGNSYKYRGRWSNIDHFLLAGPDAAYRMECRVLGRQPLLTRDETYGGMQPFRTYRGFTYEGGFSDHLPIFLDVRRSVPEDVPSQ